MARSADRSSVSPSPPSLGCSAPPAPAVTVTVTSPRSNGSAIDVRMRSRTRSNSFSDTKSPINSTNSSPPKRTIVSSRSSTTPQRLGTVLEQPLVLVGLGRDVLCLGTTEAIEVHQHSEEEQRADEDESDADQQTGPKSLLGLVEHHAEPLGRQQDHRQRHDRVARCISERARPSARRRVVSVLDRALHGATHAPARLGRAGDRQRRRATRPGPHVHARGRCAAACSVVVI